MLARVGIRANQAFGQAAAHGGFAGSGGWSAKKNGLSDNKAQISAGVDTDPLKSKEEFNPGGGDDHAGLDVNGGDFDQVWLKKKIHNQATDVSRC